MVGPKRSDADAVGDLYLLADTAPDLAVLDGYRRMEDALRRRVGGYEGEDVEGPRWNARRLARRAAELGILNEELVKAVDGLAELRNLVAHTARPDVTPERAREYLTLVQAVYGTVASWVRPDGPISGR